MNGVIYARYSSDNQREESIDGQLREQVRVRLHSNSADIEVAPHQRQMLLDNADKITNALLGYGFSFVTMSLAGYRQGSMNKTI